MLKPRGSEEKSPWRPHSRPQVSQLCTGSDNSNVRDPHVRDVATPHTKEVGINAQCTTRCVCLATKSGTSQRCAAVSQSGHKSITQHRLTNRHHSSHTWQQAEHSQGQVLMCYMWHLAHLHLYVMQESITERAPLVTVSILSTTGTHQFRNKHIFIRETGPQQHGTPHRQHCDIQRHPEDS